MDESHCFRCCNDQQMKTAMNLEGGASWESGSEEEASLLQRDSPVDEEDNVPQDRNEPTKRIKVRVEVLWVMCFFFVCKKRKVQHARDHLLTFVSCVATDIGRGPRVARGRTACEAES